MTRRFLITGPPDVLTSVKRQATGDYIVGETMATKSKGDFIMPINGVVESMSSKPAKKGFVFC
jgi:hypothetical protein